MNRLPVVEHLTPEAIGRRYRDCTDAAEKTRWHVRWLVTRPDPPLSATAAAKRVGFTPAWGRAILERYNAGGPDALTDGRRGPGADPELTPGQQAALFAALQGEPSDGGPWSGPKVATFVEDRFGVAVWPQTGWQRLKNLGFRSVVPHPRHPTAAAPEQQRGWL